MQLLAPAHNRGDSLQHPARRVLSEARWDSLPLVSSLVLGDTWQHGPTCDGLSPQLSGTAQHRTSQSGRPCQTTQIYEGTNQIQRIVIAKKLFS
jgi:hypothetical protein